MMKALLFSTLLASVPSPAAARVQQLAFPVPGLNPIRYALSVPDDYDPARPRPFVLALHPGGTRMAGDGARFMQGIVAPGVKDFGAIMVAPDCPTRSWTDPDSDTAVMALVKNVLENYSIDRRRVLVTGFSLGGRGTWFMASRHADLFTAAIPIAASAGEEPLDRLATIPTYIIHSRDDQVVPFAPAEQRAIALEKLGRIVRFEALQDVGHFQMGGYVDALKRGASWVAERWEKK